jgi:hypothetical protein
MLNAMENYLINILLEESSIKNFYEVLITRHYHCEEDFKLTTNYAILVFIDTLFFEKDGYKCLKIPNAQQDELYQYVAKNKLNVFNYVSFKASAKNDFRGLHRLVDEFGKNNWPMIFGYYAYNKALDLLTGTEDCFDIKKKIYDIICSFKKEHVKQGQPTCATCENCENDCSICLDRMEHADCITTLCRHTFHKNCLAPMFQAAIKNFKTNNSFEFDRPKFSCPLCRADVFVT